MTPMRERRFLVRDLAGGPVVKIGGDEAHQLLHVLRLRPGDEVVLFDGAGQQHRAVVTCCEKETATARKLEALPLLEPRLELTMAVAIPKSDKMTLTVQKLTELGASRIIPLLGKRTDVGAKAGLSDKRVRWRRVALEACKQSGRARLPTIEEPILFEELLAQELPPQRFLACPGGTRLLSQLSQPSCILAVGPEGGWTDGEVSAAIAQGFTKIGLGPWVLRTETAAIAAAAILIAGASHEI
jgi:16S rRNA (uracil1498-N3)-methyltransferase